MPGAASDGVATTDATDPLDVPAAFVAVDEKVYAVSLTRPVIKHEDAGAVTVHVAPPGDAVTR